MRFRWVLLPMLAGCALGRTGDPTQGAVAQVLVAHDLGWAGSAVLWGDFFMVKREVREDHRRSQHYPRCPVTEAVTGQACSTTMGAEVLDMVRSSFFSD